MKTLVNWQLFDSILIRLQHSKQSLNSNNSCPDIELLFDPEINFSLINEKIEKCLYLELVTSTLDESWDLGVYLDSLVHITSQKQFPIISIALSLGMYHTWWLCFHSVILYLCWSSCYFWIMRSVNERKIKLFEIKTCWDVVKLSTISYWTVHYWSEVFLFQAQGRLVKSGSFTHSYPFCWRSDTPLIYRAVPSWQVHLLSVLISDMLLC